MLFTKAVEAANPLYLKMYREHEGTGGEGEERWKGILLHPVLVELLASEESSQR
jgi:hypothetical protein